MLMLLWMGGFNVLIVGFFSFVDKLVCKQLTQNEAHGRTDDSGIRHICGMYTAHLVPNMTGRGLNALGKNINQVQHGTYVI